MTRTGRRFSILFAAIAALAKTGSAAARREFFRSALVLAAVALLALFAALALPATTQAQEADVLVSNIDQPVASGSVNTMSLDIAQGFMTGASPSGNFALTSVNLKFAGGGTSPVVTVVTDNSGQPGSLHATLVPPASVVAGDNMFTAPPGTTLDAGTAYFLAISGGTGVPSLAYTSSTDEVSDTDADDWTIANFSRYRSIGATGDYDRESGVVLLIRVNGTEGGDTPPPPSTDATLSALSLGTGVTLDPAFAPGTTSYTAAVANSVDEVTVTPTTTDTSATIEYLDGDDATLDDADGVAANGQQVALAVGDTVFKVQVTAEDGTTTETYTVTVTRATPSTAEVTIAADQPAFIARLDWVTFTLTRTGDAAAALDVAVALTQDQDLLASGTLAQTVSFGAGDATATLTLFPDVFQTVTQETTLTATVEAGTGYAPGSSNTASTRMVVTDPAVTVWIEETAYTFAEGAGGAAGAVIARTETGVPSPNTEINVSLGLKNIPGQAVGGVDYTGLSLTLRIQPSDFTSDGAVFTARRHVPLAIVDDALYEPDETVTLALERSPGTPEVVALRQADSTACQTSERCDVTVTITDNDASTDATLSGLAVRDGSTDLLTTFAPGTLTYAVAVGNAVDEVTVTATTTHTNATPEYLDASDTTLDDADDDVANGHQVALAVGDTVFKVQVTAEDGTTTQTYTVTVTRAETTFVSNLGQTDVSSNFTVFGNLWRGQQFETGSNSGGYTLSEIVVNIRDARTGTPAFALYTSTSDDKPDTKVVDLSGDSSTAGEQSFTPASATTLSASTKYIIVFQATSGQANLQMTFSNDIDSGASPGWGITENSVFSTSSGTSWNVSSNPAEIAIKGTAVGGTPSTDATLSDLVVNDGSSDLTLDPTFAPGTLTYAVAVGNAVDEVTVTPTTTDTGATVAYLDASDTTLDDADGVPANGHQVALAVGDTVFKVQVTAEDDTTTQTYTVTVTRAAADTPTCTLNPGDLWCGTLTVGTGTAGGSTFYGYSIDPGWGSLSPATFTHNGNPSRWL